MFDKLGLTLKLVVNHFLPKVNKNKIIFSLKELSKIKTFAKGILFINILALIVSQVDKIILSKIISLEAFGIIL